MDIYELVNTVLVESIRDIYETLAMFPVRGPDNQDIVTTSYQRREIIHMIRKNLIRCNNMREYSNIELKKISYLRNNTPVKLFDNDFTPNLESWPQSSGEARKWWEEQHMMGEGKGDNGKV